MIDITASYQTLRPVIQLSTQTPFRFRSWAHRKLKGRNDAKEVREDSGHDHTLHPHTVVLDKHRNSSRKTQQHFPSCAQS